MKNLDDFLSAVSSKIGPQWVDTRAALQQRQGLRAWQVSRMFNGPSDAAIEPWIQRER